MSDYDIGKAFEKIENELISSMIRNLDRHRAEETKEGYNWSQWQVEQIKALEEYRRRNQKIFPSKFNEINQKIRRALQESYNDGGTKQERQILQAIKQRLKINKDFAPSGIVETTGEFFKTNDRKLNSLIEATIHDMEKAETAVLRMANDKYRKIIFNAQVMANTGAETYAKAVDMATKDFLSAGINCIEYKNGRRVNIKSYADMAIRTANKRAYLQGEGAKRQEWGISTVILNKRGNPCPLCAPFVGKVFIDDVWSGGSKDGISPVTGVKYPLLSGAVKKGLYHPNCRDAHTTYFEGISTPPENSRYTADELDELAERYNNTKKQNYAQNEAERMERMSKFSLDEDNKRTYGARARQWREKAEQLEKAVENSGESGIISVINNSKFLNMFNEYNVPNNSPITAIKIVDELKTTKIGRETLEYLENLPNPISLTYEHAENGVRGYEQGGRITIFLSNCQNPLWAARTVIHECTHFKYGIGQSQWSECVCIAQELKHARKRDYLTISEKRMIIKAVKEAYPEFNWRKGGIVHGRRT